VLAALNYERVEKSAQEHREVLASVRSGDGQAVEATLRRHLDSFLGDMVALNKSSLGSANQPAATPQPVTAGHGLDGGA
jgi:DNA-binding GntR family transcriptional regulator